MSRNVTRQSSQVGDRACRNVSQGRNARVTTCSGDQVQARRLDPCESSACRHCCTLPHRALTRVVLPAPHRLRPWSRPTRTCFLACPSPCPRTPPQPSFTTTATRPRRLHLTPATAAALDAGVRTDSVVRTASPAGAQASRPGMEMEMEMEIETEVVTVMAMVVVVVVEAAETMCLRRCLLVAPPRGMARLRGLRMVGPLHRAWRLVRRSRTPLLHPPHRRRPSRTQSLPTRRSRWTPARHQDGAGGVLSTKSVRHEAGPGVVPGTGTTVTVAGLAARPAARPAARLAACLMAPPAAGRTAPRASAPTATRTRCVAPST